MHACTMHSPKHAHIYIYGNDVEVPDEPADKRREKVNPGAKRSTDSPKLEIWIRLLWGVGVKM